MEEVGISELFGASQHMGKFARAYGKCLLEFRQMNSTPVFAFLFHICICMVKYWNFQTFWSISAYEKCLPVFQWVEMDVLWFDFTILMEHFMHFWCVFCHSNIYVTLFAYFRLFLAMCNKVSGATLLKMKCFLFFENVNMLRV